MKNKGPVVARWTEGKLLIPFNRENRAEQERFMDSLIATGQLLYKDAVRIYRESPEPPMDCWVLVRPPRDEYRQEVDGRILKPEQIEREHRSAYTSKFDFESSNNAGRGVAASDLREIFVPSFDSRNK